MPPPHLHAGHRVSGKCTFECRGEITDSLGLFNIQFMLGGETEFYGLGSQCQCRVITVKIAVCDL